MHSLTIAPLFGCFTVVKIIKKKDNSVSIHHKNIQALAIEMFKVKYKLYPEITGDIFSWKGQTISTICVIVLIL